MLNIHNRIEFIASESESDEFSVIEGGAAKFGVLLY